MQNAEYILSHTHLGMQHERISFMGDSDYFRAYAIGIMRIIEALKNIESLFTGEERRK